MRVRPSVPTAGILLPCLVLMGGVPDRTPDQPNVLVTLEPDEGGAVVYLPTAAPDAASPSGGLLHLRFVFENKGAAAVTLEKVHVEFLGPPERRGAVFEPDVRIPVGQQRTFALTPAENVRFRQPAPAGMRAVLFFTGYADPIVVFRSLKRHVNPTPLGSYTFPGRASDLAEAEFWRLGSTIHLPGADQQLAYDMLVIAWNGAENGWTSYREGTDGSRLRHFLAFGKRVHAMADGKVISCESGFADIRPGAAKPKSDPAGGNHFLVDHGGEVVVYAHLKQHSVNQALCAPNAQVVAGDSLGLVGNSGGTSEPHLHVHAVKGKHPRPVTFHDVSVLDPAVLTAPPSIPEDLWVNACGEGPPPQASLLFPRARAEAGLVVPGFRGPREGVWLSRLGSGAVRYGDFDGDGKTDAARFVTRGPNRGSVRVHLSDGTRFGPSTVWSTGFAEGDDVPAIGDFDGDGRDDIVRFEVGGAVYVRLSAGIRFGPAPGTGAGPEAPWAATLLTGGEIPAVGDFDDDGRDDVVLFVRDARGGPDRGDVIVARSDGRRFHSPEVWHEFFGIGDEVPLVGDFDGGGGDDIATLIQDTQSGSGRGLVHVALSRGDRFGSATTWHDSFSVGGETPVVADFDDDGRDDIASFVGDNRPGRRRGGVFLARSLGSRFAASSDTWHPCFAVGESAPGTGDFDGDGRADIAAHITDERLLSGTAIYVAPGR